MKTRNDFVSNSSSSSFIVIADNGKLCYDLPQIQKCSKKHMNFPIPSSEYGCVEFGWQNELYSSLADKLNWCGIILLELYVACRNADLAAAWKNKTVLQLDCNYSTYRDKFLKWKAMLEKVCKERLGFGIYLNLDWIKVYAADREDSMQAFMSTFGCYIDHQSDIFEEPTNGKMFDSEEALYNFLAYEDSYIQCGNDNYSEYE